MTKEEQIFKKECDEKLYSIYSKIDEEEKIFLSYLVNQFNNICERNNKAIEVAESYNLGKYDYSIPPWGIIELLDELKGDKENE